MNEARRANLQPEGTVKLGNAPNVRRGMLGRMLPLIVLLFVCKPLKGTQTLWQIGVFNESSGEFSSELNPAQDPVFTVGKSQAAHDWFAFQPGSGNGRAGFRPHPFTILFDLAEKPKGLYTLKVALLSYSPRLPWLQVDINGHRGWFYQHPKLVNSAGDLSAVYLSFYATSQIECVLPSEYLVTGTNKLVLTALDEPGERDDAQGPGVFPGTSAIIYDALALLHDPAAPSAPAPNSAQVLPTPYYKLRGEEQVEIGGCVREVRTTARKGARDASRGRNASCSRSHGQSRFW